MGHYGTLVVAGLSDHTLTLRWIVNLQLDGGSTLRSTVKRNVSVYIHMGDGTSNQSESLPIELCETS